MKNPIQVLFDIHLSPEDKKEVKDFIKKYNVRINTSNNNKDFKCYNRDGIKIDLSITVDLNEKKSKKNKKDSFLLSSDLFNINKCNCVDCWKDIYNSYDLLVINNKDYCVDCWVNNIPF